MSVLIKLLVTVIKINLPLQLQCQFQTPEKDKENIKRESQRSNHAIIEYTHRSLIGVRMKYHCIHSINREITRKLSEI